MITHAMVVVLITSNLLGIRKFLGGFLIHLLIQLDQCHRYMYQTLSVNRPTRKKL